MNQVDGQTVNDEDEMCALYEEDDDEDDDEAQRGH